MNQQQKIQHTKKKVFTFIFVGFLDELNHGKLLEVPKKSSNNQCNLKGF